ncbi:hypothetical protein GCM10010297_55140 [Streptomyces malachitofuscus]|nr:hypothetical protein GCM10010297_55140 [Streptomyces malachitofuscus]
MSGAAAPAAERDPGLQPERTRLAWRRTTLSSTVVAVLAGKTAVASGGPVGVVAAAGVLCCACWVGFLAVAHRRIRGLASSPVPAGLVPRYAVAAVGCVVVTVVCGVGLVLRG